MSKDGIWSVSALTEEIRFLVENEIGSIQVEGEISNYRRQSSGHRYFTLKDKSSQLQAVCFRADAERLKFEMEDGQRVVASGQLTVYAPRGQYQLRVRSLEPRGQGELQRRFEELKRKLEAEGLFAAERKRELRVFPERIGLITSPTGAAVKDFLNVLERRCPRLVVRMVPVRVQGEGATAEIVRALDQLGRDTSLDVIVLTRGGGSLEDLWSFNEERVARAIADCGRPVVSAVGHEIDFTIADFVADGRAPTPSAAAEMISISDQEWRDRLAGLRGVILERARTRVEQHRLRLGRFRDHYVFREPVRVVDQYYQRLDDLNLQMLRHLSATGDAARRGLEDARAALRRLHPERFIRESRRGLEQMEARFKAMSPEATLKRGYAIAFDDEGHVVRTVKNAEDAQVLAIRVSDGTFEADYKKRRG